MGREKKVCRQLLTEGSQNHKNFGRNEGAGVLKGRSDFTDWIPSATVGSHDTRTAIPTPFPMVVFSRLCLAWTVRCFSSLSCLDRQVFSVSLPPGAQQFSIYARSRSLAPRPTTAKPAARGEYWRSGKSGSDTPGVQEWGKGLDSVAPSGKCQGVLPGKAHRIAPGKP